MRRRSRVIVSIALWSVATACRTETTLRSKGQLCAVTDECLSGLVCVDGVCQEPASDATPDSTLDTLVADSGITDTAGSGADGADTGDADAADDTDADAADSGPADGDATVGGGAASCAAGGDGRSNCGGGESCCASLLVPGGTFVRNYDPTSTSPALYPATVSTFRLDKYEITVGRFRAFLAAYAAGWRPSAGQGKHEHLNGGSGLVNEYGAYESGWNASWNSSLPSSGAALETQLVTDCPGSRWTSVGGVGERQPMGCMTWYEIYAFCIWDGGFLPSEAEWNYAAAGGSEQRVYPWSSPPSLDVIDATRAVYLTTAPLDVGSKPAGSGRWGHMDLSGNIDEFVLDADRLMKDLYTNPCIDCTYDNSTKRHTRGEAYEAWVLDSLKANRSNGIGTSEWLRGNHKGSRCARKP